ncbi:MAG: TIGR02206 family membrane protein [Planctomycetota bacterium]
MSLETFSAFSIMHAVVVSAFSVATVLVIVPSRKLTAAGRNRRRFQLGIAILLVQVVYQAYWLGFQADSGEALPLHLCDVAGAVTVAAFLIPIRFFRALLYYWGLGLSSLAFLIPVLERGPVSPEFWLFWLSHWVIVGGAIYLVAVDSFRPRWRDLATAVAVMLAYGLLTVPLNVRWGSNYMYTGDHPMPTPGDLDIAWPMPRLVVFGIAAALLMLAVHLPWVGSRRSEP